MALTKAVIVNIDGGKTIPLMFNPPSYSMSRTNQYKEQRMPGHGSAVMEYVSGTADSLSTEFFFDTTDSGEDVRIRTNEIEQLMLPVPLAYLQIQAPPQLLLIWGSLVFRCHIVSVRAEFDYFTSAGAPLRARLTVEFKGADAPDAVVQAAAPFQVQLATGQSLADIAAQRYQDPAKWRQLAEANNIDNPRKIPVGTKLNLLEGA
jgi:hypothetical protein